MAEGARLESVYTATYRGFESLPHRHIETPSSNARGFLMSATPRFAARPRPSLTKGAPNSILTSHMQFFFLATRVAMGVHRRS